MLPAVLAHPLTERGQLPESTLFVATAAICVLAAAAYAFARRARQAGTGVDTTVPQAAADEPPATGASRILFLLTRLGGLFLLGLAIAVGRFGPDDQLANLTPALVVGAGWPLLVAACALFGRVWWWIDPFDSLARIVAPIGAGDGTQDPAQGRVPVWAATPAAALVVAYLTVWPNSLSPRTISNVLLVYTIVMLAGCLALGRRVWLPRVEILHVFLGWVARARRPRTAIEPGTGATVVLGVLAGGLLYGLVRDSPLLTTFAYGSLLELGTVVAVFAAVVAAFAHHAERRQQRRTGSRVVALAMVPATAALAVALGLARNRFTTSLQLLPALVRDPLGVRPDEAVPYAIDPRPLGHEGLLALQIAVLLLGHVLGMALAARAARGPAAVSPMRAVLPTLSVLGLLLAVAVAAVAAT